MMTLAKMVARVEIARIQDAGEIGHPFEPLRGNETEGWLSMTVCSGSGESSSDRTFSSGWISRRFKQSCLPWSSLSSLPKKQTSPFSAFIESWTTLDGQSGVKRRPREGHRLRGSDRVPEHRINPSRVQADHKRTRLSHPSNPFRRQTISLRATIAMQALRRTACLS